MHKITFGVDNSSIHYFLIFTHSYLEFSLKNSVKMHVFYITLTTLLGKLWGKKQKTLSNVQITSSIGDKNAVPAAVLVIFSTSVSFPAKHVLLAILHLDQKQNCTTRSKIMCPHTKSPTLPSNTFVTATISP